MADYDYTTRMRVTSDLSGCVATEKAYGRLIEKAKELGKKSKEETEKVKSGFNGLTNAVGFFRKALTGFGVVGLFTGLIKSIEKIRDSFSDAKKQADKMAETQKKLDQSLHIQNLSKQYDQLAESAEKAAKAQNAALEQIGTDVTNRRRLDKAKLEADKQAELESLDPNDEYYSEKVAQIEAKYSGMAGNMEASNAREDIVLERQKLGVQADLKDQEAAAQDAQSRKIRAQLEQEKQRRSAAQIGSVDLNEADKGGVMDTIGKTVAQIFTGQWGRAAGATTTAGDAIRQQKAKEAADSELKVNELEESLRKSEEKAAAIRREAGTIRTKRDSLGVALEASDIEMETARRKGDIGEEKAAVAMQKKRDQVAKESWAEGQKEADRLANEEDAARAKQLMEAEKARIQQQIAAEKQRKAAAKGDEWQAQQNLEAAKADAKANGGRRGRRGVEAASQELAAAHEAANSVGLSADRALNALTEKLKKVEAILNKATSAISKNNSQRLAAQAEALTTN